LIWTTQTSSYWVHHMKDANDDGVGYFPASQYCYLAPAFDLRPITLSVNLAASFVCDSNLPWNRAAHRRRRQSRGTLGDSIGHSCSCSTGGGLSSRLKSCSEPVIHFSRRKDFPNTCPDFARRKDRSNVLQGTDRGSERGAYQSFLVVPCNRAWNSGALAPSSLNVLTEMGRSVVECRYRRCMRDGILV